MVRRARVTPDLLRGEMTHREIALKHGVTLRLVQDTSAELRPQITRTKEQATEAALAQLRRAAGRAALTLVELLDDKDSRVRKDAAVALLDRVGAIKVEGVEHSGDVFAALRELIAERRRERVGATSETEPARLTDGEGAQEEAIDVEEQRRK